MAFASSYNNICKCNKRPCLMDAPAVMSPVTAHTAGSTLGLLCCDVSADGMTIAAGTELQGEDAAILYW